MATDSGSTADAPPPPPPPPDPPKESANQRSADLPNSRSQREPEPLGLQPPGMKPLGLEGAPEFKQPQENFQMEKTGRQEWGANQESADIVGSRNESAPGTDGHTADEARSGTPGGSTNTDATNTDAMTHRSADRVPSGDGVARQAPETPATETPATAQARRTDAPPSAETPTRPQAEQTAVARAGVSETPPTAEAHDNTVVQQTDNAATRTPQNTDAPHGLTAETTQPHAEAGSAEQHDTHPAADIKDQASDDASTRADAERTPEPSAGHVDAGPGLDTTERDTGVTAESGPVGVAGTAELAPLAEPVELAGQHAPAGGREPPEQTEAVTDAASAEKVVAVGDDAATRSAETGTSETKAEHGRPITEQANLGADEAAKGHGPADALTKAASPAGETTTSVEPPARDGEMTAAVATPARDADGATGVEPPEEVVNTASTPSNRVESPVPTVDETAASPHGTDPVTASNGVVQDGPSDDPPAAPPPGGGGPPGDGPAGGSPPDNPPPGGGKDGAPEGGKDRAEGDIDQAAMVGVTTSYLPGSGDGPVLAHAVEGSDYPERQHDTGGTRPQDEVDPVLTADMERAGAPTDTLFRGGALPETTIAEWKQKLDAGERVTVSIPAEHPASTSRDATVAMMYARDGEEASQKLGTPNPDLAAGLPDDTPADKRPISNHEQLSRGRAPGEIAERERDAEAAGNAEQAGAYEQLADLLGDDGAPPTPYTEEARIANLDEVNLSGEFELVGLLDTRPGHEYNRGDTGVMRVPSHRSDDPRDPGPVHEGVFPVFRPVAKQQDNAEAEKTAPSSAEQSGKHGRETELSLPQKAIRFLASGAVALSSMNIVSQFFADKDTPRETPAALVDRGAGARSAEHVDPSDEPLSPEKGAEQVEEGIRKAAEEMYLKNLEKRPDE